ncbi:MAG TPA: TolC family protein [Limnobacter sp.]|uniref:TolC family protein n=1 Tax=Limnobacter sp. TaxID=2003368 RepID=UPI002EDB2E62
MFTKARPVRLSLLGLFIASTIHMAHATDESAPTEMDLLQLKSHAEAVLPPLAIGKQAIEQSLTHQSGLQDAKMQEAEAQLRAVGEHEWTVNAATRQRRFRMDGTRANDYEVGVSRGLRLPGKVTLDNRLSEQHRALADTLAEDSWHEASRLMVNRVLECRKAAQLLAISTVNVKAQTVFVNQQTQRVKQGDIPAIELMHSENELQRMRKDEQAARIQLLQLRAALETDFPTLAATSPGALNEPCSDQTLSTPWPDISPTSQAALIARLQSENHALRLLEQQAQLAKLTSERSRLDEHADPTVGLSVTTEQSNLERILGVQVSIPIGGAARQSRTALAQAQSQRLSLEALQLRRNVANSARLALAQYEALRAQYALAQASLHTQELLVEKRLRGYTQGEVTHTDLNLAQQALNIARREAVESQFALDTQGTLLMIDAHWLLQMDEHHP